MKRIVVFILITFILIACGPTDNAVDIAQAQSAIEAARAAQDAARAAQIAAEGLSDVSRGQTLILVLLTIILVAIVVVGVYLLVVRALNFQRIKNSNSPPRWISGPNAQWKRLEQPDLNYQIILQQQQLLAQMLSQSQTELSEEEPPQIPSGWWG